MGTTVTWHIIRRCWVISEWVNILPWHLGESCSRTRRAGLVYIPCGTWHYWRGPVTFCLFVSVHCVTTSPFLLLWKYYYRLLLLLKSQTKNGSIFFFCQVFPYIVKSLWKTTISYKWFRKMSLNHFTATSRSSIFVQYLEIIEWETFSNTLWTCILKQQLYTSYSINLSLSTMIELISTTSFN